MTDFQEKQNMQTAMRVVLLATSIGVIFAISGLDALNAGPAIQTTSAAKPSCDRECLRGFMTKYLDALIAHQPGALPVSDKVRFTENTVDTKLGEGIWKTASKLTPYRQDIIDVRQGVAGTHAVIEEGKNTVLLLVRLKVVNKKITEIETQVTRIEPGGKFSNPTELESHKRGNEPGSSEGQAQLAGRRHQNRIEIS